MKDSFIIYTSFYEPIKGLSDKQLGRIFRALFDYHVTGDVQVDDDIKMAFLFFKNQMDIDAKKYTYICEKRKQAAVRGGAPKGNGNARKKAIESEENNQNNQMVEKTTKTTLNDNDNDNDLNPPLNSNEFNVPLKKNDFEKRKKSFMDECARFVEQYGKEMVREFFDYWTEPNKSQSKMRFELQRTWDLPRRLTTWANNDNKFNKNAKAEQAVKYRKL